MRDVAGVTCSLLSGVLSVVRVAFAMALLVVIMARVRHSCDQALGSETKGIRPCGSRSDASKSRSDLLAMENLDAPHVCQGKPDVDVAKFRMTSATRKSIEPSQKQCWNEGRYIGQRFLCSIIAAIHTCSDRHKGSTCS